MEIVYYSQHVNCFVRTLILLLLLLLLLLTKSLPQDVGANTSTQDGTPLAIPLQPGQLPSALPLKWEDIGSETPTMGTEISDAILASALKRTHNFSPAEWEEFGLPDQPDDCYIKVGGKYLKPSARPGPGQAVHAGLGGPTDPGAQETLLQLLRRLTASAKRRKVAALPFRERLQHNKMLVRGMYDSYHCQTLVALLITFNFFLNAYDAHVHGSGVAPDWVTMIYASSGSSYLS